MEEIDKDSIAYRKISFRLTDKVSLAVTITKDNNYYFYTEESSHLEDAVFVINKDQFNKLVDELEDLSF